MFFSGHDDDDTDFTVSGTGGSKLANLFANEEVRGEESKQSLTYTAPRQPRKTGLSDHAGSLSSSSSVAVLHAVAVHTFKLENQQYLAQGKLGAAILGNHESLAYQVLLYKGQHQHVALANISPSFLFNVQPNSYATFYDNKRECWSLRFESEQASVDFARQVGLARASSAGSSGPTALLVQDLVPGREEPLENGRSVEVKYTGWFFADSALGQMFESNMGSQSGKKFRLGKGKVIKGWEEGLIGAKRGGRRLLVVPPALAYGAQGAPPKIPPNATLVYEIFILKIAQGRDSRSSTPVTSESGVSASESMGQALQEESVKARGASISDQLSQQSPRSEKAQLISRMARMGTPMLPMQQALASSESENEEEMLSRVSRGVGSPRNTASPKPALKARPAAAFATAHLDSCATSTQPGVPLSVSAPQQQQVALLTQQTPFGVMTQGYPYAYSTQMGGPPIYGTGGYSTGAGPPVVAPPAETSHWPLLVAENRAQNVEMRIALSKISDRVEMVLSKLGELKSHSSEQGPYMESTVLLQNVQRIVQENIKLKAESDEKNTKILTLNDKIGDMLQRNQRLLEDSTQWMEKRSDTFHLSSSQAQARINALEQEKTRLSSELSDTLSRLTTVQLQVQRRRAEDISKEDQHLATHLEEQDSLIGSLQQHVRTLRTEKKDLAASLDNLRDEMLDVQSSRESLEKSLERAQRRLVEERKAAQQDLEEVRTQCKEEVDILRKRFARLQSATPDQQRETEEVEVRWQEEKGELQLEVQALKQSLRESHASKEDVAHRLSDLQHRMDARRGSGTDLEAQVASWKSKYEDLTASVEAMKEGYERRLRAAAGTEGASRDTSLSDAGLLETKLKKAMNGLYRGLQRDLKPGESYSGTQALKIILNMIKTVTAAVLQVPSESTLPSSQEGTGHLNSQTVPENTQPGEGGADQQTAPASKLPPEENSPSEVDAQGDTVEVEPAKENTEHGEIRVSTSSDTEVQDANSVPGTSDSAEGAKDGFVSSPDSLDLSDKKYVFFDKKSKSWKPQPPPPPLFDEDDEDEEDDWLK